VPLWAVGGGRLRLATATDVVAAASRRPLH
jgi:hypothetical protein